MTTVNEINVAPVSRATSALLPSNDRVRAKLVDAAAKCLNAERIGLRLWRVGTRTIGTQAMVKLAESRKAEGVSQDV